MKLCLVMFFIENNPFKLPKTCMLYRSLIEVFSTHDIGKKYEIFLYFFRRFNTLTYIIFGKVHGKKQSSLDSKNMHGI